jgi:hypothetical protein
MIRMKNWYIPLIITSLLALAFIFMNEKSENNTPSPTSKNTSSLKFEGYIVEKEQNSFFLLKGIKKEDISNRSLQDLIDESTSAILFSINENTIIEINNSKKAKISLEDLKDGQRAIVWSDKIAESYPAQAKATKINIVEK